MKNVKFALFNFLPYEHKFLEKYLEDKSLKGWKLKSITGNVLKFNRMEPKRIKYSIDIMDSITFFDGKNTDEALDYREYCSAAGWNFVCQKGKIQVYSSEEEIEKIAIQTDEKEKFKCIFKASLKYQIINLLLTIMLLATQLNSLFLLPNMALSSNSNLLIIIMSGIWFIQEVVSTINLVIWIIKSKNELNKNKKVSNCISKTKYETKKKRKTNVEIEDIYTNNKNGVLAEKIFTTKETSKIFAFVCSNCGYTEWYAEKAENLK